MPPKSSILKSNRKVKRPKSCPSSSCYVNRSTFTKFRAHQHKQPRSDQHSKSAWALAAPRFGHGPHVHDVSVVDGDSSHTDKHRMPSIGTTRESRVYRQSELLRRDKTTDEGKDEVVTNSSHHKRKDDLASSEISMSHIFSPIMKDNDGRHFSDLAESSSFDLSDFETLPWNSSNNISLMQSSHEDDTNKDKGIYGYLSQDTFIYDTDSDISNTSKEHPHVLESDVAQLPNQLTEKDKLVDQLKNSTSEAHNRNNDKSNIYNKRLDASDRQISYSCNLDLNNNNNNERIMLSSHSPLAATTNHDIKVLKESHQNEILALQETHRRDFLDLRDRTLKWIVSKSDLMQEHSKLLANMREEVSTLRTNYNDLRKSAKEAFREAQEAINRNCKKLSLYVKEEIHDSEQLTKQTIKELKQELKNAKNQIRKMKTHQTQSTNCVALEKSFSHNSQSWNEFTINFRDALDGNFVGNSNTETSLDSDVILTAERLFKELCFDNNTLINHQSNHNNETDIFLDSYEDEETMAATLFQQ